MPNVPSFKVLNTFDIGTSLDRTGRKYLMKIVLDIKTEIGIFEIRNVPNFNKF